MMDLAVLIQAKGLTLDPREAGFLLPDGRMLDFSGRSQASEYRFDPSTSRYALRQSGQRDRMAGQRPVDHRDWPDHVFDASPGDSTDEMMNHLMSEHGLMRVDFNAGVASFIAPPTPEQIQALARHSASLRPKDDFILGQCRADTGEEVTSHTWEHAPTPLLIQRFTAQKPEETAPPHRRRRAYS